jgi:hypothetical protein
LKLLLVSQCSKFPGLPPPFVGLPITFWSTKNFSKNFLNNPKVLQTATVTRTRSAVKGLEKIFSTNPQVLVRRSVNGVEKGSKIEKIFCENPKVLRKFDVNRIKRTTEAMSSAHNSAGFSAPPQASFS